MATKATTGMQASAPSMPLQIEVEITVTGGEPKKRTSFRGEVGANLEFSDYLALASVIDRIQSRPRPQSVGEILGSSFDELLKKRDNGKPKPPKRSVPKKTAPRKAAPRPPRRKH